MCCSVLQCVAVCCRMLQIVAEFFRLLQCVAVCCKCVATGYNVLQRVAKRIPVREEPANPARTTICTK